MSAEAPAKAEKPVKEKKVRNSMAKNWGEVFHQAATENRDQAWVQDEMLKRFPNKAETISKWTVWYKNFYNMGKIKGYENPVKVNWTTAEDEAKKQAREAKAAQKKAEKEATRQAKLAEKEALKAQKKAEKEAAREAKKAQAASAK